MQTLNKQFQVRRIIKGSPQLKVQVRNQSHLEQQVIPKKTEDQDNTIFQLKTQELQQIQYMNQQLMTKNKILTQKLRQQQSASEDYIREIKRLQEINQLLQNQVQTLREKIERQKGKKRELREQLDQLKSELQERDEGEPEEQQLSHSQLYQLMQYLQNRQIMQEYQEQEIDTDAMTYEQLLELEEQIGHVSKGLTNEQIKQIPKFTLEEPVEDKCSVCLFEFKADEKCRELQCKHLYHSKCIKEWLLENKCCPLCKNEKFLQGFLSQKSGNFIEGLNSHQLELGIWRGDLTVTNLRFKSTALMELGLHYIITQSYIGRLSFHIPWKSINYTPCQVDIEDMEIVIHPISKEDNQSFDASDLFSQLNYLDINQILYKCNTNTYIDGIINNITLKMIENMELNFRQIKILIIFPKYSIGLDLKQLLVSNVNEQHLQGFFNKFLLKNLNQPLDKNILIKKLGLYKLQTFNAFQNYQIRKYDFLVDISLKLVQIQQNNGQVIKIDYIEFYLMINEIINNYKSKLHTTQKLKKIVITECADQSKYEFKVDQDQEADQRKNKNKRRKKIDYILFQNLMLFPITVKLFESLNHKFGLFIYFI
ncbi:hypothetical protein pb186bvf_003379 [Paramecium bursaria]